MSENLKPVVLRFAREALGLRETTEKKDQKKAVL